MVRTVVSVNKLDLYNTSLLDKEFAAIEQKKNERIAKTEIKKVENGADKDRPS